VYDQILAIFEAKPVPEKPGYWKARCPAHEDRVPSLSLWLGRKGNLMISCWAGCPKQEVLAAVGLKMSQLMKDEHGACGYIQEPSRKPVAHYVYKDVDGAVIFRVVRTEPKGFYQERWEDGKWKIGLQNCKRVLYRADELKKYADGVVVVCEGEKDVDRLWSVGLPSTCNSGGTGAGWRDSYSGALRGCEVRVIADNDESGLRHADAVVGSLVRHGVESVRYVILPGEPVVKDVSDYLNAGYSKEDLIKLINAAPEWVPQKGK